MRRRIWVPVIVLVISFLITGVYLGWRFTRANEIIKSVLLEKIEPFVEQGSDVGAVEVGLNSLRIREVRLIPKNRTFVLQVEQMEIGYRFWNVVRRGFSPKHLAHEIVLMHPRIILNDLPAGPSASAQESNWDAFDRLIAKLETIDLTVLNGEVIFQESGGRLISVGNRLNGWIQTRPIESAEYQLSGNLFESKTKNLYLSGNLDLSRLTMNSMELHIDPSNAPEALPFVLPEFVRIERGEISGHCHYDSSAGLHGQFDIKEGHFGFRNAPIAFEGVQFHAGIKDAFLTIEGVAGFHGAVLRYEGEIENLLKPALRAGIQSNDFALSEFAGHLVPEISPLVRGRGRLALDVTGPLDNLKLTGHIISPDLALASVPFHNYQADFELTDSVLTVKSRGGDSARYLLQVEGQTQFQKTDMPFSYQYRLQGDFRSVLPETGPVEMHHLRAQLNGELHGGLHRLSGYLEGGLDLSAGQGQLTLFPSVHYLNQELSVVLFSNKTLNGWMKIEHPFTEKRTWSCAMYEAQDLLHSVLPSEWQARVNGLTWDMALQGQHQQWQGALKGVERNSPDPVADLRLKATVAHGEHQIQLSGSIKHEEDPLALTMAVRANGEGVFCDRLRLSDMIVSEGISYYYDPLKTSRLHVRWQDLPVHWLTPHFHGGDNYAGLLTGTFTAEDFRKNPHYAIEAGLNQGVFHGLEGFGASLSALWRSDAVETFTCTLTRNNEIWLTGSLVSDNQNRVSGKIEIPLVDAAQWQSALFGQAFVSGFGSGSIRIEGAGQSPIVHGTADLSLGRIGPFQYESAGFNFRDTLFLAKAGAPADLHISDGRITALSGTDVTFGGVIPWTDQREMDVSLGMEGNFFKLLTTWHPFFKEGTCQGRAQLRLGGRPGAMVFGSGHIEIEQGNLLFSDYLKEMKGIRLNAEIDPANRFVRLHALTGEIAGSRIRVWSTPGGESDAPLIMESPDLNFGRLHIETDQRGIMAHLPGFMEGDEYGRIVLEGSAPGRGFTISGGPKLSGTMALRDLRLTYPLLKENGMSGTADIVRFLYRVDWDLRVKPLSDVHYVRSIESALGNVYADLQLKKEIGSLYVHGILEQDQFQVWGNLESTEGTIEALDLYFRPERITFDYPRGTEYPIVHGRASATLIDSLGTPSTIWLNLNTVDDAGGIETTGGSWENILFRFSTDNPNLGRSEAHLLAALGYSSAQMRDRAYDALGMQVENMIVRPIVRPIERQLRRHLGLDVFRVSSKFSSNLIQMQSVEQTRFDPRWLFKRTRLTLGKYLAPGLFIIYSGQIQSAFHLQYQDEGLGFRHALSLEYTFRPDLFLEMEYTYDSKLLHDRREDKRIWLKHVFPL